MLNMIMGLKGWIALIVVAVLAGIGQVFGGIGWLRKGLWAVAALVMLHATWLEFKK